MPCHRHKAVMIRSLCPKFALAALTGMLPLSSMAQNWALEGIDPVAYSQQGQAVAGRSDIATEWHGELWYFATEENRDAFEANPKAYAPGLDGLCVVALSEGRAEPGNPRHFIVIGQRTYFARSDEARQKLLQDPQGVLQQANAIWAKIRK